MAAAGAEAMRLLGEAERGLFGKTAHGKTAGGRPIDEELVDKLAAEAEEGYDVEETRGVDEEESAKERLRLIVVYEPDEERVVASIPAMPGVLSRGRTREEARINVLDALAEMIDLREAEHEPRAAAIERESLRIGLGERTTADEGQGAKRDPWTDPDPQPGDFDAELEAIDPRDVEFHEGNPDTKVIVLPGMNADDLNRLAELAVERGKNISEILVELVREA
jgi:predicted RNase H-like HicB family nuclease